MRSSFSPRSPHPRVRPSDARGDAADAEPRRRRSYESTEASDQTVAGEPSVPQSLTDEGQVLPSDDGLAWDLKLFEQFADQLGLAHGVRRLVYTSSPSVTFTGADQCGIDESVPYAARWLCHYPRSKALAEQAVLAANGRNGLLTCALRPHLIWGPGDRHLVPRLIERARRGQLRRVGDGRNLIDMVYVENAAEAHLRAAEALVAGSPVCGQAYFISQGEPVRCWEWIDTILACAGLEPVRRGISARAACWAGWACEAAWTLLRLPGEPRMTRFLALQLARSHYFSIERARRDFGYQPRVSTADGLRRLAAWLQAPAPHAPSPAHLPQPEGRT